MILVDGSVREKVDRLTHPFQAPPDPLRATFCPHQGLSGNAHQEGALAERLLEQQHAARRENVPDVPAVSFFQSATWCRQAWRKTMSKRSLGRSGDPHRAGWRSGRHPAPAPRAAARIFRLVMARNSRDGSVTRVVKASASWTKPLVTAPDPAPSSRASPPAPPCMECHSWWTAPPAGGGVTRPDGLVVLLLRMVCEWPGRRNQRDAGPAFCRSASQAFRTRRRSSTDDCNPDPAREVRHVLLRSFDHGHGHAGQA